jgi:hypothetical protein
MAGVSAAFRPALRQIKEPMALSALVAFGVASGYSIAGVGLGERPNWCKHRVRLMSKRRIAMNEKGNYTKGLKEVVLHLARTKEFPDGSSHHYYRFVAPLDADGHLDAEVWKKHRDQCRVVRSWGGEEDDIGHLVHRPGGSWGFHYDIGGDEGDESGFKLSSHVFLIGEYVSIRDDEGELHTFRVVSVEDI